MAAQTIAEAAILEGKQAQAFPFFGAERRGAPVMAFARIDDKRICDRTQVSEPDMLVVMDESLLEIEPVAAGLKKGGCAVVNSALAPSEIDLGVVARCVSVDATSIALEMLRAPIVNTSILGAMAKADDFVRLESIQQAIMNRFGEKLGARAGVLNGEAARTAYDSTIIGRTQGRREYGRLAEWAPAWNEIPIGNSLRSDTRDGVDIGPASSSQNLTGRWKWSTPRYDREKCIRCLRCWWSCPDAAVIRLEDDYMRWDMDHCKGCGICADICPVSAIEMVQGAHTW